MTFQRLKLGPFLKKWAPAAFKVIGGGPGHFFSFGIYERASHWEPNAFYGIEKACPVVEIRHFECRENGLFL